MPRVPVYDPQVGPARVSTRAAPLPLDNTGAHVSRAGEMAAQEIAGGAGQIEKAASDALDQADATITLQSLQELEEERNRLLYDKDGGLVHQRGMNAMQASDAVYRQLEQKRKALEGKLYTPRAKAAYEARVAGLLSDTRRQIETHVARELDTVTAETVQADLDTKLQTAAFKALSGDIAGVRSALAEAEPALALEAKRRGLSPEAYAATVRAYRGKVHSTALRAMLSNPATRNEARAYWALPGVQEELGAEAATFARALESATLEEDAENHARVLAEKYQHPETGVIDATAALAEIDKMPAGELKDAARERLMRRIQTAERLFSGRVDTAYKAVADVLNQTGSLRDVPVVDKAWLSRHAPDEYYRLQQRARQLREERRRGGEPTAQQVQRHTELQAWIFDNQDEVRAMTADEFRRRFEPELSSRQYQDLFRDFEAIKNRKESERAGPTSLPPLAQAMVYQRLRELKLVPEKGSEKSWSADELARKNSLESMVLTADQKWRAEHPGKTPTPDQYQQWVRDASSMVKVAKPKPRGWLQAAADVVARGPTAAIAAPYLEEEEVEVPEFQRRADAGLRDLPTVEQREAERRESERRLETLEALGAPTTLRNLEGVKELRREMDALPDEDKVRLAEMAGSTDEMALLETFNRVRRPDGTLPPRPAARSVAEIPDADRRLIEDALRQTGQPITEFNILTLYQRRSR